MKSYKQRAHTEGLTYGKHVLNRLLTGKNCSRCYVELALKLYQGTQSAFMDGYLSALIRERDKDHHPKFCKAHRSELGMSLYT